MESWLAENWYYLISIVAVSIVAFWRLHVVEKDLEEHLNRNNPAPHPACPVHSTRFDELMCAIKELKDSVRLLDMRIYDFMRSNGYRKPEE